MFKTKKAVYCSNLGIMQKIDERIDAMGLKSQHRYDHELKLYVNEYYGTKEDARFINGYHTQLRFQYGWG